MSGTGIMRIKVMNESLILVGVGLLDLLITIVLIGAHGAAEGNPIMAYWLQFGIGAFVAAKLALIVFPVMVAEWSNIRSPRFTRMMMRTAIGIYVGAYLVLFWTINIAPRITGGELACAVPDAQVSQQFR
jgi:hypothetical protein